MVNIDSLHREKDDKLEKKKAVFVKILQDCHNKIKLSAKNSKEHNNCFYAVPKYKFGVPLYDMKGCILFLTKSLVNNGFDVWYTHPNLLFISWKDKTNQSSIKYPVNQASITFNNNDTSQYNNSTNTNTNTNTLNEYKSINLGLNNNNNNQSGNNSSNFKSIDSYKPSNKLVYDTKTISNIDTKLYNLLKK
tara:strand:+ start:2081 stop:2653 length:573 start_codon:yes stop_codon:yes gene_type:complete